MFNHSLFKSLLFFGAGAVLTATGERDMERLGGLFRGMPQTGFAFLVGCVAISALPPFNGFVSEWLTFQAILLTPALPSWGLKLLSPAVGAMLALAAALAAACFVKTFGVAFLGRPRSPQPSSAKETDRFSLAAMFALAVLCLLAGVLPGLVIDALRPVVQAAGRRPDADAVADRVAVDRADRGEPQLLQRPARRSLFILISSALAASAIHRFASDALRRAPAWDCGFPDAKPGDAIHRRELQPADPAGVRRLRVSARAKRSTCRRPATCAPANFTPRCTIRSGIASTCRSRAASTPLADAPQPRCSSSPSGSI